MPVFFNENRNTFLNSFFKYFFCCCKTNRYIAQNSDERTLSEHNKHLLDREYATLRQHKINTNARLFYQKIIENFETIILENIIAKNITDYTENTRQSKFNDFNHNNDHIDLFMKLSESIYSLMENKKFVFLEKIKLIKNFRDNTVLDTHNFTEAQAFFIFDLFSSVHDYIYLDDHINKTIKYNIPNNSNLYNINIHNLFIDGKILYKDFNYYKYNIDNKGPFLTDYNRRYIERCVRAFSYMLQNRLQIKNNPLTLSELINVNSILGGSKGVTTATQSFHINGNSNKNIIQLLSLGIISSEVINSDNSAVKYNKQELEDILLYATGIKLSLDRYNNYQDAYRLSAEHFDMKDYYNAREYLKHIDDKCNTGDLLQSLSGVAAKPAFKFKICLTDKNKYIEIQYIYNTDKLEVVKQLLKSYYIIINNIESDLEKVRVMVWLCNVLEMIHPFRRANSRTVLYSLLPILLYQQDLWLTKTLYDNQKTLSFFTPPNIAKNILSLCLPLKNIVIMPNFNWLHKMNYNEKFRISCAIGDLNQLEELLDDFPLLMGEPIVVSSDKDSMSAVEFALRHAQVDIAKYLLNFTSWKITKQHAKEMHSKYLESDEYYFHPETEKLLESLSTQQ